MQIIIVGYGNIGRTLTEQLIIEGHDITVIDSNPEKIEEVIAASDVLGIVGNATSIGTQIEAGVAQADLLIAVTRSDEVNLLCCLIAKRAGARHIIARVSNPIYNKEIQFFKEDLGLSMIINPQLTAAREMINLLKFPSALHIDSFPKSKVESVGFRVEKDSAICNKSLKELAGMFLGKILIPIVERDDEVIVPDGDFFLKEKDIVTLLATNHEIVGFFRKVKIPTTSAKSVMIVGGGRTTIYLAKNLIEMGVKVKIIERDIRRCEMLIEMLPKAMIIHGDATDKELLIEEGIEDVEAFVTNSNIDEENIMLAMCVKTLCKAKVISKVHRVSYNEIIDDLDIGSVIYPKNSAAEHILKYVRGKRNTMGSSSIETLYRLNDNRVEALEMVIRKGSSVIGKPLKDIPWKSGVIIGCINHKGSTSIANGNSVIKEGDTIILFTDSKGMKNIEDALR
ncbi:MAG: Trk system potassium transporter TrkA [Eubacterium sp.]|nr:Trk system potassium transporter TrkA [Eubacterium sp.]